MATPTRKTAPAPAPAREQTAEKAGIQTTRDRLDKTDERTAAAAAAAITSGAAGAGVAASAPAPAGATRRRRQKRETPITRKKAQPADTGAGAAAPPAAAASMAAAESEEEETYEDAPPMTPEQCAAAPRAAAPSTEILKTTNANSLFTEIETGISSFDKLNENTEKHRVIAEMLINISELEKLLEEEPSLKFNFTKKDLGKLKSTAEEKLKSFVSEEKKPHFRDRVSQIMPVLSEEKKANLLKLGAGTGVGALMLASAATIGTLATGGFFGVGILGVVIISTCRKNPSEDTSLTEAAAAPAGDKPAPTDEGATEATNAAEKAAHTEKKAAEEREEAAAAKSAHEDLIEFLDSKREQIKAKEAAMESKRTELATIRSQQKDHEKKLRAKNAELASKTKESDVLKARLDALSKSSGKDYDEIIGEVQRVIQTTTSKEDAARLTSIKDKLLREKAQKLTTQQEQLTTQRKTLIEETNELTRKIEDLKQQDFSMEKRLQTEIQDLKKEMEALQLLEQRLAHSARKISDLDQTPSTPKSWWGKIFPAAGQTDAAEEEPKAPAAAPAPAEPKPKPAAAPAPVEPKQEQLTEAQLKAKITTVVKEKHLEYLSTASSPGVAFNAAKGFCESVYAKEEDGFLTDPRAEGIIKALKIDELK
ncbi:MAG: hypothetical protein K1060chlam5_00424 [Candidatus Anoxychlamydiales bacterium]|nr:hypothetical protein [Candidatus Anoxychlamydiales bacterium]